MEGEHVRFTLPTTIASYYQGIRTSPAEQEAFSEVEHRTSSSVSMGELDVEIAIEMPSTIER